jgi:TRAP-type C4-dicarboxylate transport system permease small subunit
MDRWNNVSCRIRWVLTLFGAALLLSVAFGITAEIVIRKLFNATLGGVDEFAGYAFAIFTSFACVVAALDKANIRIDVLRSTLPSWARNGLDLLAQLAMIGFIGILNYRALLLVLNSWEKGSRAITPQSTPLVWPQALWLAGFTCTLVVLITMFALSCRALLRRDLAAFHQLAAPLRETDELDPRLRQVPDPRMTPKNSAQGN